MITDLVRFWLNTYWKIRTPQYTLEPPSGCNEFTAFLSLCEEALVFICKQQKNFSLYWTNTLTKYIFPLLLNNRDELKIQYLLKIRRLQHKWFPPVSSDLIMPSSSHHLVSAEKRRNNIIFFIFDTQILLLLQENVSRV